MGKKTGLRLQALTERKPEMGRVSGLSVEKKAVTCEFNLSSAKLDSMIDDQGNDIPVLVPTRINVRWHIPTGTTPLLGTTGQSLALAAAEQTIFNWRYY
jgi:hypothetical protein